MHSSFACTHAHTVLLPLLWPPLKGLKDKYQWSKVSWFHMSRWHSTGAALSCVCMRCVHVTEEWLTSRQHLHFSTAGAWLWLWRELLSYSDTEACVPIHLWGLKKTPSLCLGFDPVTCHKFLLAQLLISAVLLLMTESVSAYLSVCLCIHESVCADVADCGPALVSLSIGMHAGQFVSMCLCLKG